MIETTIENKIGSYKTILILKLIVVVLLFLTSGVFSSYLYYYNNNTIGAFLPAMIYTSCTIVVFVLTGIRISIGNLLMYYLLMMVNYLVIYFLTMFSSWFAPFFGIITAGAGALTSFILTDRFIAKFSFNKRNVFLLGGLSFLILDIFYMLLEKQPLEYIYHSDSAVETLFSEIFITWHLLVGVSLFWNLSVYNAKLSV